MRDILTAEHRNGQHEQYREIGCPLCHPHHVTLAHASLVALLGGLICLWGLAVPGGRQLAGSLDVSAAVFVATLIWGCMVMQWERSA